MDKTPPPEYSGGEVNRWIRHEKWMKGTPRIVQVDACDYSSYESFKGIWNVFPHFFHNFQSLYTVPFLFCMHSLAITNFWIWTIHRKLLLSSCQQRCLNLTSRIFFFLWMTDTELVRCLGFCFWLFFLPKFGYLLYSHAYRIDTEINSLKRIIFFVFTCKKCNCTNTGIKRNTLGDKCTRLRRKHPWILKDRHVTKT